jgi:methylphosphotriester-DNA--protein-cysteine methyltransferase
MLRHSDVSQQQIIQLIRSGEISLAGNSNLKVYGKLNCGSGKRMKKENRVFFKNETEALDSGFRPCGHCMRDRYAIWKRST